MRDESGSVLGDENCEHGEECWVGQWMVLLGAGIGDMQSKA